MQPPPLATARLSLRALTAADAADLHGAWSDPETLRFWHRIPRTSQQETAAVFQQLADDPSSRYWAIRGLDDSTVLGHVGLVHKAESTRGYLGYLVDRAQWGRGLGTEAAQAVLAFAFEQLRLSSIELWIYEGNERSVRVADKLGCRFRARFVQFNLERRDALPMLVYGITAEEHGLCDATPEPTEVYQITPVIACVDVQAAVDFYTQRLSFTLDWIVGSPPGDACVTRRRWNPLGVSIRFTRVEVEPAARPGFLDLAVADVDSVHRELRAAGLTQLAEPVTQPWGLRELHLTDCVGQRLRFITPAR